mmetsp:Transcript_163584/g.524513  ORF Transcript_163584/g.524513 Transcript_163584/m.524513 type:complete len:261 (-) Transcript_163584:6-788(-)
MLQGAPSLKKLQSVVRRLQQPGVNCRWFPQGRAATDVRRTLCVGCGDGSYELGMLLANATEDELIVTFYEAEARLKQRYTNFAVNAWVLRALGATLLFDVDATRLMESLEAAQSPPHMYGSICFNFPQTGSAFPGTPAWRDVLLHLIAGYFSSAARVIETRLIEEGVGDGEVVLVMMDRPPYGELPFDELADAVGLQMLRRERFDGGHLGLYRHRMTWHDRVVQADEDSTCHIYGLRAFAAEGESSMPSAPRVHSEEGHL